ncbi:MAG: serine/threonine protein kinase [Deltaproteobacteria bacterium]|nr:serine/threonine protein kinase [Deltaproteobacteria bacterium]
MEPTDPEWTTGSGETPIDTPPLLPRSPLEALLAAVPSAAIARERPGTQPFEVEWTAATEPHATRTAITDRYELLGPVGGGASAEVHRARDRQSGELLALKVLRAEQSGEQARRRFVRELDSLVRLKHPNVVEVRGYGLLPTGQPLLALELLDGIDLESQVAAGARYDDAQVRALAFELASGLAAIHQAGVVHRDFKPANVMVLRKGGVKVVDFGISRLLDPDQTRLTAAGAFLGSPATIAPEQIDDPHGAGPAADLYALGASLFWLLSGRAPYRGSITEVLEQHRRAPVPELPDHHGLGPLVRRLLAKDPKQRPTANELERQLRPHPGPASSRGPFALLLLLVIVGGALITLRWVQPPPAPRPGPKVAPPVIEVRPRPLVTEPEPEGVPTPAPPSSPTFSTERTARRAAVRSPKSAEPSPPSPTVTPERAQAQETQLQVELQRHGLSPDDLGWLAPGLFAQYQTAIQGGDRSAAREVRERIVAQAAGLRTDDDTLRAALDRVLERLRRGQLPSDRQRALEAQYFELRRRLGEADLDRSARIELLRGIHRLSASIH